MIDNLAQVTGYIDIHTHHQLAAGTAIFSLYSSFERATRGTYCSLGIHPRYIDLQRTDDQFKQLHRYAVLPNVLAIGECGLDKLTDTSWDMQVKTFALQVNMANVLRKPLIIHCVRAYDEVLQVLREHSVRVPVIFHGYNKGQQLADRLLKDGYYLSFGAALLQRGSNASQVIQHIPRDRFFLETDEASASIEDIYLAAAGLLETGPEDLILQLQTNFQAVFGI